MTDGLQQYAHLFETLHLKPHTLDAEQEKLLAGVGDIFNASENTFGALDNSDITFGDVHTESGETVALTNGLYSLLLESKSQDTPVKHLKHYMTVTSVCKTHLLQLYHLTLKDITF